MRFLARPALGLLVLVWFVLVPASAQAARPGTLIASGQAPSVAVDANGTGYVAYNAEPPGRVALPGVDRPVPATLLDPTTQL
ncbi:MAG: hypothetical protein ACRDPA_15405, partial [Solirubrobacteraceae bacterium]